MEIIQLLRELSADKDAFGRIARQTNELDGAKIYGAAQALKEVKTIWDSIYNTIASHVAPIIANIVHAFERLGLEGNTIGDMIDRTFAVIETNAPVALAFAQTLTDLFADMWTLFYNGAVMGFNFIKAQINGLVGAFKNVDMFGMNAMFEKITGIKMNLTEAALNGLQLKASSMITDTGSFFHLGYYKNDFAQHLKAAMESIKNLFHGKAESDAQDLVTKRALTREGRENEIDPFIGKNKTTPLGYAINATGMRPSLSALRLASVPEQGVADKVTHGLLNQIVHKLGHVHGARSY